MIQPLKVVLAEGSSKNGLTRPIRRGQDFEQEVFGVASHGLPLPYIDFWPGVAEAIANQPKHWRSIVPPTRIAFSLRFHVAKHFSEREAKRLHLFCSINQSIDQHFSTDGFFLFGSRIVTLDLATWNKPGTGADFLLTSVDIGRGLIIPLSHRVAEILLGHKPGRWNSSP